MSQATLIDLAFLSDTFPDIPSDEIKREVYLDTVKRYLENNDVVFLEGDSGVGKSTFLAQFVRANSLNSVSYVNNRFDEEKDYNDKIDDNFLNAIYTPLLRKIKKTEVPLFFVFDGLDDITEQDLNVLIPILGQLPWTKAKFIFSGFSESLNSILPSKIKFKSFGLSYFSFTETKEFLKDFEAK